MIYIRKVILENFQSHKYTEIEFDKYLNVIVGPSDHGKTAIIRGIKWALFNEPSGDYFIREGERECSVTVVFSNNVRVKRYRSKSKNYYYIYDNEGNETILEGFGTKVPEEVIKKTSIKKMLLDSNVSSSINIGEQLEGPFLLSENTSTRANAIGRLVGVHIIDDALKDTLKDVRNLKATKRNHEETLEKLKDELKGYDYLEELKLKSQKLNKIKEKISDRQRRLNNLIEKLQTLKDINKEIILHEKYLSKLNELDRISAIEKSLDFKIKNFTHIYNIYRRLNQIKTHIERDKRILSSLKYIETIEKYYKTISNKEKKLNRLNELHTKYNLVKENVSNSKSIIYKLKNIEYIEENAGLIEKKYNKLDNIIILKNRIDKVNKSLSIGKIYIERLSILEPAFDIKNAIESKYTLLKNLLSIKDKYENIEEKKVDIYKKLAKIELDMEYLLEQYKKALSNLEVCPVCYSAIDKNRIENIIDSYK